MFISDEVMLDVSFATARSALSRLAAGELLLSASQEAYGHGTEGLARVGPAGLSKLVRVQVCELAETAQGPGIAIRWEAAGAAGGLFPVLDADLRVTPAGDSATSLTLTGAYRPPLGPVGEVINRAVLHRLAAATVRRFIVRLAANLTAPVGEATAPRAGPAAQPACATELS